MKNLTKNALSILSAAGLLISSNAMAAEHFSISHEDSSAIEQILNNELTDDAQKLTQVQAVVETAKMKEEIKNAKLKDKGVIVRPGKTMTCGDYNL